MKISFIVWARYHRRAELLAQHLGASLHYIYAGRQGQLSSAPVRYMIQARDTWRVLGTEQPDIVFIQNPPIFGVLAVFLYCWFHHSRYIIDSHSGAFLAQWRWSRWLHRWLSKAALMTIVHNSSLGEIVINWGCRYRVIGFTPGNYPDGEPYALNGQFNVGVISTYGEDEPLPAIWAAAHQLPDVNFYITGDCEHAPPALLSQKPANCHLTGYLSYERYVGLLRQVDAVMDLTTCNHTLLMGGFEAVSLDKPLIVSDYPVLREYFSLGAVHVPNTPEGICNGVRKAQQNQATLQRSVILLHQRLDAEWEENLAALQQSFQMERRL